MEGLQTCRRTECQPPRARRWIPLSLKAYCVLLVALGAGSISLVVLRVYRYEAAVAWIERVGGTTSSPRGAATGRAERGFDGMRKGPLSPTAFTAARLRPL